MKQLPAEATAGGPIGARVTFGRKAHTASKFKRSESSNVATVRHLGCFGLSRTTPQGLRGTVAALPASLPTTLLGAPLPTEGRSRTDLPPTSPSVLSEVTILFAPKEFHSLSQASLSSIIDSGIAAAVARVVVVIAPPIEANVERGLRALAQCAGLSVVEVEPFSNPYTVRNELTAGITTKYTLHMNSDVFGLDKGGSIPWLEALVLTADANPTWWCTMPMLMERTSRRPDITHLHVWWSSVSAELRFPHEPRLKAKFDNEIVNKVIDVGLGGGRGGSGSGGGGGGGEAGASLEELANELCSRNEGLLFLEDHCVLVRTAMFESPMPPLFDPAACFRWEFFDLAWSVRARGGQVGMACDSVVVYEKAGPLAAGDLPYYLARRHDEIR